MSGYFRNTNTNRKPCKKCLLSEMDRNLYESLEEQIFAIPDYLKTTQIEYNRRLDICSECDYLYDGMCRKCGCFVELRAATANNYCPDVNRKW